MKIEEIKKGFINRDIGALAKAITLVESSKEDEHNLAFSLINESPSKTARVIGVSGPPGVGKSTFLNSITKELLKNNDDIKIAILAVDPSSEISGGSILGDKTRMGEISSHPDVFIRPTATGSFLGGTASRTFETIKMCESFGFDYIFIETVGVGQSESMVAHMVDQFILLANPSAGDDLQGMKRGVLEHVDLLLINKCDGELESKAKIALNFFDASDNFKVETISALMGSSINKVLSMVDEYFNKYDHSNRVKQFEQFATSYFENYVNEQIRKYKKSESFSDLRPKNLKQLQSKTISRWREFKTI